MKTIIAKEIDEIEWQKYGRYLVLDGDLTGTSGTTRFEGKDYISFETDRPLLDTISTLGRTTADPVPCPIEQMERHLHTEEAQIPLGHPIVFLVAPSSESVPHPWDIEAVIVRPGTAFVLDRGVWHSASHGLSEAAPYLWQAWVYRNEPSVWVDIPGGPILLQSPESTSVRTIQ